jgi:dolichol-phosphate mannosyltransferase
VLSCAKGCGTFHVPPISDIARRGGDVGNKAESSSSIDLLTVVQMRHARSGLIVVTRLKNLWSLGGSLPLWLGIIIIYTIAVGDGVRKLDTPDDPLGNFSTFRNASIALASGKDLYAGKANEYVYPPLLAFLYQPFSSMSLAMAGFACLMINLVVSLATLWLAAREMASRLVDRTDQAFVLRVALIAAVLTSDRIFAEFRMWETNVLVLLMCVVALVLEHRRPWIAGTALGFAFNIKYLPLAFAPYLLLRRRWSVAGAFLVSAICFAMLPALSLGWNGNLRMLCEAYGGLANLLKIHLPNAAHVYPMTDWRTLSLPSGIARVTGWPEASVMLVAACGGLLFASMAALLSERHQLDPFAWPDDGNDRDQPLRAMFAIEWTLILMLALVFSPFTNAAHLYLLILANAACAAIALSPGDGSARLAAAAGALIMFLGISFPPGGSAYRTARNFAKWMSLPAYCVLLNCATLYWSALRLYAGQFARSASRADVDLADAPDLRPAPPRRRSTLELALHKRLFSNTFAAVAELAGLMMKPKISSILILGMAFLVSERLLLSGWIPLIPQEAYYWMYSRHLAFGYFDHPPFVALMIWLGTAVFGTNEFGVRIVGQLLMLGSVALLYKLTRVFYGRATAVGAIAGFLLIPLYYHLGWVATMDSALVFFTLAAMLGFLMAVEKDDPRGWWIAGASSGLAMLSKYTGVFCLVGMFAAILIHRPWRFYLTRRGPWLASTGSLLLFSPVVVWNYQHHWASFRFQTVDRLARSVNPLIGLSSALAGQTAVALPLAIIAVAVLAMLATRKARRLAFDSCSKRYAFAIAFSVPLLSVLTLESLRTTVHINWAAPALLSLIAPAAQHVRLLWRLSASRPSARALRRLVVGVSFACAVFAAASMPYAALIKPRGGFLAYEFGPWPALAGQIHKYEEQIECKTGREPLVVADGPFELASEIAFYRAKMGDDMEGDESKDEDHRDPATGKIVRVIGETPPFMSTTSQWLFGKGPGNAFPFWLNRKDWVGCDVIYVTAYSEIPREVRLQTDSVELMPLPDLGGKRRYNLVLCHNLRDTAVALAGE